jgi:hypothetical protein
MKTNFLSQLFLLSIVSLSLYSCTADSVDDSKSQATLVSPSKPQIPTDVTAEVIIVNPK